jgi:hypothetical protein
VVALDTKAVGEIAGVALLFKPVADDFRLVARARPTRRSSARGSCPNTWGASSTSTWQAGKHLPPGQFPVR